MSYGYDPYQQQYPPVPPGPPGGMAVRPPSLNVAFLLMIAGACVTALSSLIGLAVGASMVGSFSSSSSGSAAVAAGLGVGLAMALVQIGLWLWMAFANRAGQGYARIVSSVFFGLYTLLLVLNVIALASLVSNGYFGFTQLIGQLTSLLTWLLGLGAIVLLWRGDVTRYINIRSGRAPAQWPQQGGPGPYGY